MVVIPRWVLQRINKDEGDEPLPLLAFQRYFVSVVFMKYSKKGRLSSSYLSYDDTKHYQVQSEHRRIQNPFKHLKGCVFA